MAALNGDGNLWKWVAAILVSILLAGLPGLVYATKSPSRDEVELIRERQQDVLQRLARIETRLDNLDAEMVELREQQERHDAKLTEHLANQVPGGK